MGHTKGDGIGNRQPGRAGRWSSGALGQRPTRSG